MDGALLRLAARQHGLVTLHQLANAGHRNLVRRRLESGEWVLEQAGVVRPALSGADVRGAPHRCPAEPGHPRQAEGLVRLVRLVVAGGLPKPELEYPIREGHRVIAVLDGYFPAAAVALEVDDWATHLH